MDVINKIAAEFNDEDMINRAKVVEETHYLGKILNFYE
jgi:hypothetical protein